ncbi:hypothetical protein ANCDUO_12735 [Ancylostoma duodenale]|uniref:Mos1 transposase HTH domain-containing protein n=1 Tax=Ancylostoma duodenale TaxID=51022 RepID=A0A0C2CKP8_9BILA|nr:hypothetical protein ANCDUO_12735 [Ancylostoma duodenale]
MEERQRVRVLIFHFFERGFTAAQACKEIRANDGRYRISASNVYYWYKRFRSGNHSVVDEMRPGRPTIYDTKLAAKQMLDAQQGSCNACWLFAVNCTSTPAQNGSGT